MKLRSIQVLRAVAALLVVAFHISGIQTSAMQESLGAAATFNTWPIIENGYAGVDLFFVISGFIMVVVTRAGKRGAGASGLFLASRVMRIYPAWWLFAGAMTGYMAITYGWVNTGNGGWADFAGTTSVSEYLVKSFLLIPQPGFPVLNVGWTLIHEMYFYLVFALTLLFARRWLPYMLAIWAGLLVGLSFVDLSTQAGHPFIKIAVHPMTMEFILGAFAGLAVCSGRRIMPKGVMIVAVVWLVAALVFTLPPSHPGGEQLGLFTYEGYQIGLHSNLLWSTFVLGWGRVIAFGLPCALLVYAVANLEVEGQIVIGKPLEMLGDWSYSLYLSHILVLSALARLLPELTTGPLFAVIGVPACILIAAMAYYAFERPLIAAWSGWRKAHLNGKQTLRPAPMAERIW
ncbi:MAG: acyltransferase [Pseudomonadota bacterium]